MSFTDSPNKYSGTPVGTFRDPLLQANFDDPKLRKDKEYGKTLLSRIYKEQNNQSSTFFFGGRNVRWMDNWQWAMGRQDMKQFMDYVNIDGSKAYVNIDFTQNRTGSQFVETLVDSMCLNQEYACVRAIDAGSIQEKEQLRKEALFRMHSIETINSLQEKSGVHLEAPTAYVPDDELAAEVYFKLEHRLPKEIESEIELEKIQHDNDIDVLKSRLYRDFIVVNCGCTKVERRDDGFIFIRKCIPANMVYNFFMSDTGKYELSYIGELDTIKVREVRRRYGKSASRPKGLTEKEIFEIAKSANQYNNSNRFYYYWNDSYMYATDRPYDDYGVQVFDCEVKVFDTDYYVSREDKYGKEYIQPKRGIPTPQSEKAKVVSKDKYTVYRGVWAIKADTMIYWGPPDITIKPYMDITECLFSYSIVIPNNDGDYVPSLFERALEPLREYSLAKLKRKQLIANLRPAGITVDIETSRDIDLGGGNVIGWDEVLRIYNQTGIVVWSSRGVNPNERENIPITEMPNAGSIAQLTELTNIMNSCMQEIRALLGVPVYRDGSDLKPRMGQAVVENQEANANNVTDYIPRAYRTLMQETLNKCCIMRWDDAVLRDNKDDLMDTVFEVGVEMKPTMYEKQLTEQQIQIAMGTNPPLISFKDAFYIRNIKNFKLQQLYLSSMIEKNKKEAAQQAQAQMQQNQQIQQASLQQKAKGDAALQQQKMQMESASLEAQSRAKKEEILLNGLLMIFQKTGEMPQVLQPLLQQVIQNVAMPLVAENAQMKQGLSDMAQQQQQQQQQAQQPPQDQQQQPPDQSQGDPGQQQSDQQQMQQ